MLSKTTLYGSFSHRNKSITQIHDYTGHVEDESTNAEGRVELWLPPQSYIMMAPLR